MGFRSYLSSKMKHKRISIYPPRQEVSLLRHSIPFSQENDYELTHIFCTLHLHVHMRGIIIFIRRIPFIKFQNAVHGGEPDQDACPSWHIEMIRSMIDTCLARDAKEPYPVIIINGIRSHLIAGQRVVVMRVIDLKITGMESGTIERRRWIYIRISVKTGDDFTRHHCLCPYPRANANCERRLHLQMHAHG